MTDPLVEYERRRALRQLAADHLGAQIDRLGQWRIGLVMAGVATGIFGSVSGLFLPGLGAVVLLPMAVLFVIGVRLDKRKRWEARIARHYEHGLRRVSGSWMGRGIAGDRFLDANHLAASDLDLFGKGSLFERVCTARTAAGEERLADWFKVAGEPETIRQRQSAVADLRDRLDLREGIAGSGAEAAEGANFDDLIEWGDQERQRPGISRRRLIEWLGWVNLFVCLARLGLGLPGWVLLITVTISAVAIWPIRSWTNDVITPVEEAARELVLLGSVLARFEAEPFESPSLLALREKLRSHAQCASSQIRRLAHLADWLESRRNAILIPFRILFLWDARMAFAVEDWRRESGPMIRGWIDAVAEMEALSSLAAYAHENPADPFPTIVSGSPRVECTQVGHPLMAVGKCVRNDASLNDATRLLMVSGSNMSGKSTLLRSIGVNVILALAGGPVRAKAMTLTPLGLAATLRVQDSLSDGRSRFFAEVVRVRASLDAARRGPVLFLFDELFAGTNSADRIRGAAAVIRAFIDTGAIGLVTTHDLAVTEITNTMGGIVHNVHFADQWVDGEMRFDHTMREGVVTHTNGIALMRAVGLEV